MSLGLVFGALLLALTTPMPAHAAPPEVTASENPVVIPLGHTTKEITLTWSLEPGLSLANLTVTESGTPALVLNQPVSSPPGTGTVPLTVTYGKTYTARLRQAITNVPLGSPLTITTKLPGIPDVGCALQCITRVDVEPHGGWAQFTIKTNETRSYHARGEHHAAQRQRRVEQPRRCYGVQRDGPADRQLDAATGKPAVEHDLPLRRARP